MRLINLAATSSAAAATDVIPQECLSPLANQSKDQRSETVVFPVSMKPYLTMRSNPLLTMALVLSMIFRSTVSPKPFSGRELEL